MSFHYFVTRFAFALAFATVSAASLQAKERQLIAVSAEMKQAAKDFLATLDEQQRKSVAFEFTGPERTAWHFIPKERIGVSFKEMKLQQRRAARALMRSVLSDKGYLKASAVMSLEQVLREMEADRENVKQIRDPEKYWFTVFGSPAGGKPWGWRLEGHHLSLNFTSIDGKVASLTPIFLGAYPAEVRVGPRVGLRVLGHEEDQARALMAAFTAEQRAKAIISLQAPGDVLTGPGKPIEIGKPSGMAAADMTNVQRSLLWQMATDFLENLRPAIADKEIRAIKLAGVDDIHFAWAGGLEREDKHYFRLHGPTFILEYDNAQGNHVHVIWHSRGNDFAAEVLHRHYQESPHHHGAKEKTRRSCGAN